MLTFLVTLPNQVNNAPVLRALEYGVIALMWLFFMWVIRAVWVEVKPPRKWQRAVTGETKATRQERRGRHYRLHVIKPEEHFGVAYDVGEEATIGRAPGCAVSVDYDSYASTVHARVFHEDGRMFVEDLGSTNGTWVNTVRINERTRLEKGDLIQVGATVFEVGR